jgi:Wax ester synthase-like Acyl-CoA acyltransferase domain/MarR family
MLPRYRQKLGAPRTGGLAWPSWEHDQRFEIEAHVRHATLPSPGDKREFEATLTEHTPSEMLAGEDDADQLVERVVWAFVDAERRVKESHARDSGSAAAAPARSVRRATARRASNRRATARTRQGDTEARIIEFLARHPGSTAGDLARGLNVNPGSVSIRLTQLSKAGEIKRASHGYSTNEAARSRTHQRPPGRSH